MQIIGLHVEDIMRIRTVETELKPGLSLVLGENSAGKSSLLNAITWALMGKRSQADVPVREGEEHGTVVLDLEELKITLRVLEGGSRQLLVEGKDGEMLKKPSALLEQLVGHMLDPLAFDRAEPAKQRDMLLACLGIDPMKLAARIDGLKLKRRDSNRDVGRLETELKSREAPADPPLEKIEVADLMKQADEVRALHEILQGYERLQADTAAQIEADKASIARLEKRIAECEQRAANAKKMEDQKRAELEAMPDYATLSQQAADAGANNARADEHEITRQQHAALDSARAQVDEYEKGISDIGVEVQTALSEADFGVDGIAVGDMGVLYRGRPFGQAASNERITLSTAIAMKMRPKSDEQIRVMIIRDGSLLDAGALEALKAAAETNDYQILVERVGTDAGEHQALIIEDGALVAT